MREKTSRNERPRSVEAVPNADFENEQASRRHPDNYPHVRWGFPACHHAVNKLYPKIYKSFATTPTGPLIGLILVTVTY